MWEKSVVEIIVFPFQICHLILDGLGSGLWLSWISIFLSLFVQGGNAIDDPFHSSEGQALAAGLICFLPLLQILTQLNEDVEKDDSGDNDGWSVSDGSPQPRNLGKKCFLGTGTTLPIKNDNIGHSPKVFSRLWIDNKSKINSISIDPDISVDLLNNSGNVGGSQTIDVQIGGSSTVSRFVVGCIQFAESGETLGENCHLSQIDCQLNIVQQQEKVELYCQLTYCVSKGIWVFYLVVFTPKPHHEELIVFGAASWRADMHQIRTIKCFVSVPVFPEEQVSCWINSDSSEVGEVNKRVGVVWQGAESIQKGEVGITTLALIVVTRCASRTGYIAQI